MAVQIRWLADVQEGPWARLAAAWNGGLPVPDGFVVTRDGAEESIREAYEQLKMREHTHFVAVRGPHHAVIEILGSDRVVHALRAMCAETPSAPVLVQTMVNSVWCGRASWEGDDLRIHASAGLLCLDPDIYVLNSGSRTCTQRLLNDKPRKVFRGVDGTTKRMQVQQDREPLAMKYLEEAAQLAKRAGSDITWALDHRRVWLLSVEA